MKQKKSLAAAITTTVLLLSAPTSAQWYLGANAGSSKISFNNAAQADPFIDLGFDSATTTSDTSGTGVRLFGGYQLHKYLALEAAYVDLGKFGFRTDVMPAGALNGNMKISGLELAAIGTLPINERFGVFARAGAFSSETKTSYSGSGSVEVLTGAETQKKRRTQVSYGAGATFNVSKNISVRGEWSRYTKLGDALTGGQTDANLYSIGLVYRF
jgi:OmpA-OmpF porin, OOP family